ncbi:PepSY domain-containing protein [Marinibaculum pumilum]|uniref:PepSY domain-containing protein n=1 Tax=Marinibaculum pumilum TaxID=1766165 RepID=A0ABV7L0K9_9PROT
MSGWKHLCASLCRRAVPGTALGVWALAGLLWTVGPAAAGPADHDQARAALEAGEILPLPAILDRVQYEFIGQVLEVELERKDGRWLYEINLLAPDGQVLRLHYDARTTALVGAHGRNLDAAIRHGQPPYRPPPPAR